MCMEGVIVIVGQADESLYIALFVASGSIKKLFLTDFVDIYLFSIFFSIDFAQCKSLGLLHAYCLAISWFINFDLD